LKNPWEELEDLENPFLLDPIDSTPMRHESEPPSSMLFGGTSDAQEEGVVEEETPWMTTTQKMKEASLPTMSPMRQAYRTMSPSPRLETSSLWDPFHESSMGTEPEQKPSSLSTWDT